MDDSDDKVRRNLVVFSGLVLAAAWLGHPELWLLSQITATSATPPPPAWKVTTLALCVHIYLTARYWFSTAHEVGRNTMERDWNSILDRIRTQTITEALQRYHLTQKQPSFLVDDLRGYVQRELSVWTSTPGDNSQVELISVEIGLNTNWDGIIAVQQKISGDKRSGIKSGGNTLRFIIPTKLKNQLMLKTAFQQVIYSRTAVEYFVPVVLASFALIVLIQKLVRNFI
jgi:hypothetical protein